MKAIRIISSLLAVVSAAGIGCDGEKPRSAPAAPAGADPHPGPVPLAEMTIPLAPVGAATRSAAAPRVVFLGDSLTAGLGLEAGEAFPAVVGRLLAAEGLPIRAVNGGVSGDTTAGGLRRLDWLLRQGPDVVVVGLGGNDGLRGLDPTASKENLRQVVRRSREAGASVLLLGMLIPPNYGPEYAGRFRDVYPRLAGELDVPLVPFLLEGVGGEPSMNQPDGIHPTAEGQARVARNVLPHLRDVLARRGGRPGGR